MVGIFLGDEEEKFSCLCVSTQHHPNGKKLGREKRAGSSTPRKRLETAAQRSKRSARLDVRNRMWDLFYLMGAEKKDEANRAKDVPQRGQAHRMDAGKNWDYGQRAW